MNSSPTICYKFPSRSRPEKFFDAINNIKQMSLHQDYFILVTFDKDDPTMNNQSVCDKLLADPTIYFNNVSSSKSKVHAFNRDMDYALAIGFDILILMSDDMKFVRKGFDQQIISDFQKYFPDGDGLLHYPDGFANERLITMPIMGEKYYSRFGYIYHPEYISLHCDNEQQEVAKRLGKYKYINEHLFDHNHPAWGRTQIDDQYLHTESFYKQDEETFKRREAKNFDL